MVGGVPEEVDVARTALVALAQQQRQPIGARLEFDEDEGADQRVGHDQSDHAHLRTDQSAFAVHHRPASKAWNGALIRRPRPAGPATNQRWPWLGREVFFFNPISKTRPIQIPSSLWRGGATLLERGTPGSIGGDFYWSEIASLVAR